MKKDRIEYEAKVGFSEAIWKSLEMCVDFEGGTVSAFCRQAALEKLIAKGYLKHPALAKYTPGVEKTAAA